MDDKKRLKQLEEQGKRIRDPLQRKREIAKWILQAKITNHTLGFKNDPRKDAVHYLNGVFSHKSERVTKQEIEEVTNMNLAVLLDLPEIHQGE